LRPDSLALPFARSTLIPYLSIMLTFLATITKHAEGLLALERSIPWHDLTQFFAAIALGDERAMDLDCAVCPLLVERF
jgi:hypothetical protein